MEYQRGALGLGVPVLGSRPRGSSGGSRPLGSSGGPRGSQIQAWPLRKRVVPERFVQLECFLWIEDDILETFQTFGS